MWRTFLPLGVARFLHQCNGMSAVEFALLLPFMLFLYVGGAEIGEGMAIQFKVTRAARTAADLASRYPSIDTQTMSSIINAAFTVMAPYQSSAMSATISQVTTDSVGSATIAWSCSLRGVAHAFGAPAALPSGVNTPNMSILWGEVSYPYKPRLGQVLTGAINIRQEIYFYPRLSASVSGPPSSSACPTS